MIVIGIDIGTTKLSGIAFNIDKNEVVKKSYRANDFNFKEGRDLQDANKIVEAGLEILKELINGIEDEIIGIGVTGQMHGIVFLDRNLNPISPLYTWQYDEPDKKFVNLIKEKLGEKEIMKLGTVPALGFGGLTYSYLKEKNKISDRIYKFSTIHDLFVAKLTGSNKIFIDYTDAASFGMLDVSNLKYNEKALEVYGVKKEFLPELVESGTIAGELSKELKNQLNIKNNVKVGVAIGDNQASFAGTVKKNDYGLINIGTGSQISIIVDKPILISGIDTRPYFNGKYLLVGAAICGGYAFEIYKNFVMDILKEYFNFLNEKMNINEDKIYDFINTMLDEKVYNTIKVKPYFLGKRVNPDITGEIINLTEKNFNFKELCNAVVEGIISELKEYYEEMVKNKSGEVKGFYVSGGGVKKIRHMREKIEDIFSGKELMENKVSEEACMGVIKMMRVVLKKL